MLKNILFIIGIFFSLECTAVDNYYPFVIPWNDSEPFPFPDSYQQDFTADNIDKLIVDGDKIRKAGGDDFKLWGLVVEVSDNFPPKNKNETEQFVAKLKKYGFNFVRIAGVDYHSSKVFPRWSETGKLPVAFMLRLDQFVAELRSAGIYYAFALNDSPTKGKSIPGVTKNSEPDDYKAYKLIQLYDPVYIDRVSAWLTNFLEHKNPITGFSYAEDPANFYISLVGEDSIFYGYFKDNGKYLSKGNKQLLEKQFNGFLQKKYSSEAELKNVWGGVISGGVGFSESLSSGDIALTPADDLDDVSEARRDDVLGFLYHVDDSYAEHMTELIRSAGYEGLLAVTNGYYGLASLKINYERGDASDVHPYFDHPRRIKKDGQYREVVANENFVAAPAGPTKLWSIKHRPIWPFDGNFYKIFTFAFDNKPLIISEWNHAGFSDFSYQGPLMLNAYSSLQGFQVLTQHLNVAHGQDFKEAFGTKSLAVQTNPVLMALSPSLSLAHRRSYINEAEKTVVLNPLHDYTSLWEAAADKGLGKMMLIDGVPLELGFTHKLRINMSAKEQKRVGDFSSLGRKNWISDTGEINWAYKDTTTFLVNTDRYIALTGNTKNKDISIGNHSVKLASDAAMTLISLDGKAIKKSSKLLLTVVGDGKNSGMKSKIESFKYWDEAKHIVEFGSAPTLLKKIDGTFSLYTDNKQKLKLYGVLPGGEVTSPIPYSSDPKAGGRIVTFKLGGIDTPWIVMDWVESPQ